MPIDNSLLDHFQTSVDEEDEEEKKSKAEAPAPAPEQTPGPSVDDDLIAWGRGAAPAPQQEQIPTAKMDDDKYLRYARKRLEKSWFPQIEQTLVGMGAGPVSIMDRALGNDERANEMTRVSDAFAQAAAERDPEGVAGSVLKAARGVGTTLPPAIIAGVFTGGPGAIIYAAGIEANDSIARGEDAGLKGKALAKYVGAKGAIEGGIAGAFQMVGAGGAEKVIGELGKGVGKQVAKHGTGVALKRLGVNLSHEVVEEIYTEVGHAVADKAAGVDENALTATNLAQLAAETTLQTVMTMGIIGAPGVVHSTKEARRRKEIIAAAKGGKTPSRKQWKEWGMPAEAGMTAKDRKAMTVLASSQMMQESQETIQQAGDQIAEEAAQDEQAAGQVDPAAAPGIEPQMAEGPQQAAQGVPAEAQLTPQETLKPVLDLVEKAADAVVEIEQAGPMKGTNPDVTVSEPTLGQRVGDFIKDDTGRVGVSTAALDPAKKKVGELWQRFMTTPGDLPVKVHRAKERKEGGVSQIQHDLAITTKEFDKAMSEVFGKPGEGQFVKGVKRFFEQGPVVPEQEADLIDAVLKGEAPDNMIDKRLLGPVLKMRNQIDALSRQLIKTGALSGELVGTITDKLGVYVTRSYRAFDDPKWGEKVPIEVRNMAEAWIRDEMIKDRGPNGQLPTEAEVKGRIENILTQGKAGESATDALSNSNLATMNTDILKMRKDVPEVLKELLGEYKDARVNYARSITKMAEILTQHKFMSEIAVDGLQGGFFRSQQDGPIIGGPMGDLVTQIKAGPESAIHPLNGMYTTPEIKAAFEREANSPKLQPWMGVVIRANGFVKSSKTILSHVTQIRNLVANVGFAVSNNHWDARLFKEALGATKVGLFDEGSDVFKAYHRDAVGYGIIGQSVHAEELRANMQDAANAGLESWAMSGKGLRAGKTRRVLNKLWKGSAKLYQAGDDIWKVYAWEHEQRRYRKAYPVWSDGQVKAKAAEIVKNTYPTYSRLTEAVRTLRQIPLTGTFVSFPAEVIRTQYHTVKLGLEELNDPQTRDLGARRLAGSAMSLAGVAIMTAVARAATGISRDEEEDLRNIALPPWQQNSQLLHFKPPKNGVYSFIDMSYLDPKNTLITPLRAALRGDNPADGIWDAFKDLSAPFADEELLFQKFTEVWRNDSDGRNVYNVEDAVNRQAIDVGTHLASAWMPGSATSINRLQKAARGQVSESGKKYSLPVELVNNVMGLRGTEVDIRQSAPWRFKNHMTGVRHANDILLSAMNRRGNVTNRELASSFQRTDGARTRIYNDMMETAGAAVRLGIPFGEVVQLMRGAGVPMSDLQYVNGGFVPPIKMTKTRIRSMSIANPAHFKERIAVINKMITEHAVRWAEQEGYDITERQ